jgi:hypothetical protein
VKTAAGYILTAVLWPLALILDVLWIIFSEACDWADRCGQRRHRRIVEGEKR